MKNNLRRLTFVFGIICAFALVAAVVLRVLIHSNRAERDVYYSTIVQQAKTKDKEDRRIQTDALEAEAKKRPGSLALIAMPSTNQAEASKRMWWLFDEPYNRLLHWRNIIDGLMIFSVLFAIYCHLVRQAIIRKEPKQQSLNKRH